ncbi:MAG: metallopeptidase family protein [Dehalococcoidia bacterium]
MDIRRFERLVADVYAGLPEGIHERLDNVEVIVLPRPTREHRREAGLRGGQTLLGFYQGVPLTERGGNYHMALPDRIFVYAEPHTRRTPDPAALREEVRRTLLHEIAHYFGIEEQRLHELDLG